MFAKINPFTGLPELAGLEYVFKAAAPTSSDNGYSVPTLWLDATSDKAYLLIDVTAGIATWLKWLSANVDDVAIRTYDAAILSGAPVVLRLSGEGSYAYVKAYPTISAAAGASTDPVADNPYSIADAALSGAPVVFGLVSGGVEYFFKAFPVPAATTFNAGDWTLRLKKYADATLAGTPRIACAVVAGTSYYFQVWPNKS